jgi:SAM-dependent methyltransferase
MPRIESELFYKNAIKKHGLSPQGVCWLSYAHQQIRFEIICDFLPKNLKNTTLTDAGCGFGDFYIYLQNNYNIPKRYIGIDSLKIMCDIAKKRTEQKIIHADITNTEIDVSDYVICSGAMNILTPYETVTFISNCYKASKKAFIFNILTGKVDSQTYNYLSKERVISLAKDLAVSHLEFREDYLKNDICIAFYKEAKD